MQARSSTMGKLFHRSDKSKCQDFREDMQSANGNKDLSMFWSKISMILSRLLESWQSKTSQKKQINSDKPKNVKTKRLSRIL
ncbi:hypothetical protein NPIL_443471 [Nephila pilipes]|uniref:Uncharacterized protein n=1 Tax=Nephila pilipes TaxID=299642 RepID=A0A8X6U8Q2_NEPPI|nr:hypothetical protein NPIL_443471 [Nephila pilipes]